MTHDTPIRVDHVGIAVNSVADAEPVLTALGCEKLSDETVEDRFRWVYYRLGDASRIELIEPIESDSFLTDFLDRHGPGLHHVTLEVADIDAVVESLEAADCRVVDRAEFDTWTEAFVSPANPTGTLFQLMEYHDDYHAERLPPEELYVNGGPVEDVAEVER
ncbi:VOC family protein [Haloarchaeobius sp. DFWS5]|uniref:VOC family protein n=1 Tax=Haloarchaeobius sp. DFWS5 TaxID=3446114 RepID=UPI003EC07C44